MFADPVGEFVRRAFGLMRPFDEVDQARVDVCPGAPLSSPSDASLPTRAPVEVPALELIDPLPALGADGDVSWSPPASSELPGRAPNTVPTEASPPASARRQAEIDALPSGLEGASALVGAPSLTVAAEHGQMGQTLVDILQTNRLDDRDRLDTAAPAPDTLPLDGLAPLLRDAAAIMDAADAATVTTFGTARWGAEGVAGDPAIALGGNAMTNAATVVTEGGPMGVLAVLGDVRLTTAVTQLNLLATAEGAVATASANGFDRVELPSMPITATAADGAVRLDLDIVGGDFLDVLRITQVQGLDDRDAASTVLEADDVHSLGGNVVENVTRLSHGADAAELVIVEGDYVAVREIVQLNVLDDGDRVHGVAGATGGGALTNRASLATRADGEVFAPLPDDLAALVAEIGAGAVPASDTLAPFDADGDGVVRALLVRGDYVDVKSIRQSNVLADADALLALPPSAGIAGAAPVVATGGNALTNEAALVDAAAGARATYAAGERYDTEFLLRADLLTEGARWLNDAAPALASANDAAPVGFGDGAVTGLADDIFFDAPGIGC